MLAACLTVGLYIAPVSTRSARTCTGRSRACPTPTDVRKPTFGRLLGLSNGLPVVAGIGLIWIEMRDD